MGVEQLYRKGALAKTVHPYIYGANVKPFAPRQCGRTSLG